MRFAWHLEMVFVCDIDSLTVMGYNLGNVENVENVDVGRPDGSIGVDHGQTRRFRNCRHHVAERVFAHGGVSVPGYLGIFGTSKAS